MFRSVAEDGPGSSLPNSSPPDSPSPAWRPSTAGALGTPVRRTGSCEHQSEWRRPNADGLGVLEQLLQQHRPQRDQAAGRRPGLLRHGGGRLQVRRSRRRLVARPRRRERRHRRGRDPVALRYEDDRRIHPQQGPEAGTAAGRRRPAPRRRLREDRGEGGGGIGGRPKAGQGCDALVAGRTAPLMPQGRSPSRMLSPASRRCGTRHARGFCPRTGAAHSRSVRTGTLPGRGSPRRG